MKKALIPLLLLPILLFGQKKSDYEIYSKIIDSYFAESYNHSDHPFFVTVDDSAHIDNFLITLLFDNNDDPINNAHIYDTTAIFPSKIELNTLFDITKAKVKNPDKYKKHNLKDKKFRTTVPIKTLNPIDRRLLNLSYSDFNKKYPNCRSIISFSPVFYSDQLATVFVNYFNGFLSTSAYIIIIRKKGKDWVIYASKKLYMS